MGGSREDCEICRDLWCLVLGRGKRFHHVCGYRGIVLIPLLGIKCQSRGKINLEQHCSSNDLFGAVRDKLARSSINWRV